MIVVMSSILGLWTWVRLPPSPLYFSKEICYGLFKFMLSTSSICVGSSYYFRSFNCAMRSLAWGSFDYRGSCTG